MVGLLVVELGIRKLYEALFLKIGLLYNIDEPKNIFFLIL